ncbi:hypothetical protein DUK53_11680 [Listeria sp. SHR_NRA_18]|uniref:hypothetical protein n=1 Tax=Listeria sp. SHR_NRA_18 TaxID=2269046 RepID=UPI00051D5105|nr:hypothetical protein [Listeria sp. SHR_NRA_18]KGL39142.1 hypothetical protein EP56_14635 [Listeriaceae bacterium FSL A5-0209]RQW66363.1 hypothetical protein DUK53_11680 [Listeria sp. SHR_NRA_18]
MEMDFFFFADKPVFQETAELVGVDKVCDEDLFIIETGGVSLSYQVDDMEIWVVRGRGEVFLSDHAKEAVFIDETLLWKIPRDTISKYRITSHDLEKMKCKKKASWKNYCMTSSWRSALMDVWIEEYVNEPSLKETKKMFNNSVLRKIAIMFDVSAISMKRFMASLGDNVITWRDQQCHIVDLSALCKWIERSYDFPEDKRRRLN